MNRRALGLLLAVAAASMAPLTGAAVAAPGPDEQTAHVEPLPGPRLAAVQEWAAGMARAPAPTSYDMKTVDAHGASVGGLLTIDRVEARTTEHAAQFRVYRRSGIRFNDPVWLADRSLVGLGIDLDGDAKLDYLAALFRFPDVWHGVMVDPEGNPHPCSPAGGAITSERGEEYVMIEFGFGCFGSTARLRTVAVVQLDLGSEVPWVEIPRTTWGPWVYRDTFPGRRSPDENLTIGGGFPLPVAIHRLDVAGMALNLTATQSTADGFLRVSPCGQQTEISNLSYQEQTTRANFVITPVAPGMCALVRTSAYTHLFADLQGVFLRDRGYHPLTRPARVLDTRQTGGRLRAGEIRPFKVPVGSGGIGQSATSVSFNLTVTGASSSGYVTVFPCGDRLPGTSSINFAPRVAVANGVLTGLSPDGTVCLFASTDVHVIIDLNAWMTPTTYRPLTPTRALDTRDGTGGVTPGRWEGRIVQLPLRGRAGIGESGVVAGALNVTATGATAPTFVTVYPCGPVPRGSNLNIVPGRQVANTVVVGLAVNGTICLTSPKPVHLIADVVGWFPAGGAYVAVVPQRIFDSRG